MREEQSVGLRTAQPGRSTGPTLATLQLGARSLALLLAAVVLALLLEGETPQDHERARALTFVGVVAVCAASLLPRRSGSRLELMLLSVAWAGCALAVFGGPAWPWRSPRGDLVWWSLVVALPAFVLSVVSRLRTASDGRADRVLLLINTLMLPGTLFAVLLSIGLLPGMGGGNDAITIRNQMPGRVWITPVGGRFDQAWRHLLPTVWSASVNWPCVSRRALPLDRGDSMTFVYEASDRDFTELVVEGTDGQLAMMRMDPQQHGTVILSPGRCEPLSAAVADALRPGGEACLPIIAADAAVLVHLGSLLLLLLLLLGDWRRAP